MRIKGMLLCMLLFALAITGPASAAIVPTVGTYNTEAAAIQALENWRGTSDVMILETFEDFDSERFVAAGSPTAGRSFYPSFSQTQFYVDGGIPGEGRMRFSNPSNFGVTERDLTSDSNAGRTLNWNSPSSFGMKYLDSGDISRFSLNRIEPSNDSADLADLGLTSLFFFMFDVSDIDGRMIVTTGGEKVYEVDGIGTSQENGLITFLGIRTDADDFIAKITWEMNSDHDGFGLDNVGTLNHVPLPASLLLLGSGLLGLGAMRRKN